ncbi:MAG: J domain-containing protein [Pseudomonadota bacterium]
MTHYDVLEVSPKASAEVIRAAYKSLMQRYHPDKNPDRNPDINSASGDFEKTASLIAQAYEVVGNADSRAAYDRELGAAAASSPAGQTAAPSVAQAYGARTYGRQQAAKQNRSWFIWLLVLVIIVAGATILLLSKGRPAAPPAIAEVSAGVSGRAPVASDAVAPGDAVKAPAGESAADRQARTINSFATSLNIELVSVTGTGHVLAIPEIGLRVDAPDPLRWVKKIEDRREELLRVLISQLARADYEQLLRPEREAYLKQLIARTVLDGIAYEDLTPPPPPPVAGGVPVPPPRPLEVLLPQSFTVR